MTGRIIGGLSFSADRRPRITIELTGGWKNFINQTLDGLLEKELDVKLVKHRNKRSLDANAYAWVLIDKLAAAMGITKEEVYREAIRKIGGVSETVCVQDKAVDKLRDVWSKNGIGWQSDTMPSKIPGCTNVILYYGSSAYDTKQMSGLIDQLISDCQALGIETLPPDKLAAMMGEWGNGTDNTA